MIHLDYRDARPIYAQIADNLRSQIAAGILRADDRLPSVRELAAELAINPNTIQRAYRELEAQGFIASVAGKGCFVCGKVQEGNHAQWQAFDDAAKQLLKAGITPEELIQRILEGGSNHA